MWSVAPFAVTFKVYVFNVTNPESVTRGGKVCISTSSLSRGEIMSYKMFAVVSLIGLDISKALEILLTVERFVLCEHFPRFSQKNRFTIKLRLDFNAMKISIYHETTREINGI